MVLFPYKIITSSGSVPCMGIDDLERQLVWIMDTRIVSWFKVVRTGTGEVLVHWSE